MRKRKIRGHKRRWKQIEDWRIYNLNLNLDYIKVNQRDYVKFRVHPWGGLSLRNSFYPEPKGKTKQKLINGLIDIYEQWKMRLDELGEPYYLKIWLYDNRLSMSQVVCAIGEYIEFYDKTFNKQEKHNQLNVNNYSNEIRSRIELFKWDGHLDEDAYDNTIVGLPEEYGTLIDYYEMKKWFDKLMTKPHKTVKVENSQSDLSEVYFFQKGNVWIGEKILKPNNP